MRKLALLLAAVLCAAPAHASLKAIQAAQALAAANPAFTGTLSGPTASIVHLNVGNDQTQPTNAVDALIRNTVSPSSFALTGTSLSGSDTDGVELQLFTNLAGNRQLLLKSTLAGSSGTAGGIRFIVADSTNNSSIGAISTNGGASLGMNFGATGVVNTYQGSTVWLSSSSEILLTGHLNRNGGTGLPVLTGTGCAADAGYTNTDSSGSITTTAATSCNEHFAVAYSDSKPVCWASSDVIGNQPAISATTTDVTITMAALTGHVAWGCWK